MPVFVEDPSQFSKQRLKSELIAHKVELPSVEKSKKQVYLELYLKHIGKKNAADFSSDEEEDQVEDDSEEEKYAEADVMDLSLLTDEDLKAKLLQYGVKAGPIVVTTRSLYEKKLQRLMASQPKLNGMGDAGQYSDSEEEEEEESGSEQQGPETVSHMELNSAENKVGMYSQEEDAYYPQCFVPSARWMKPRHRSVDSSHTGSSSTSHTFSITQMIENRSPHSIKAETERRSIGRSEHRYEGRVHRDFVMLDKYTMTNRSLYLTPKASVLQQLTTPEEPVNDVLMEMFPETLTTPTGISATRRRPIKGAAGRPVQFKYPEIPVSPATLERQEIQRRLVPIWVQITFFLLVASLLYLIYASMEDDLENPFTTLLDNLSQETEVTGESAVLPSSQDMPIVQDVDMAPLSGEE